MSFAEPPRHFLNTNNKEGFELANNDGTKAIPAGTYFYKPRL